MKKIVLLAFAVFSFVATAKTSNPKDNPLPMCNPCDWVR
jgi:hypothetical protein